MSAAWYPTSPIQQTTPAPLGSRAFCRLYILYTSPLYRPRRLHLQHSTIYCSNRNSAYPLSPGDTVISERKENPSDMIEVIISIYYKEDNPENCIIVFIYLG